MKNEKTMKIAVVYRSKTGSAKVYAEWIGELLNAPVMEWKNGAKLDLSNWDIIVYGGGLYVAGVNGLANFVKAHPGLEKNDKVKLIIFGTGATPPREDVMPVIRAANIKAAWSKDIPIFYFRGGFDFSKLGWLDKLLMTLMKIKIKRTPVDQRTPDQRGMLEAYEHPLNFAKKDFVEPLVTYVSQLK